MTKKEGKTTEPHATEFLIETTTGQELGVQKGGVYLKNGEEETFQEDIKPETQKELWKIQEEAEELVRRARELVL